MSGLVSKSAACTNLPFVLCFLKGKRCDIIMTNIIMNLIQLWIFYSLLTVIMYNNKIITIITILLIRIILVIIINKYYSYYHYSLYFYLPLLLLTSTSSLLLILLLLIIITIVTITIITMLVDRSLSVQPALTFLCLAFWRADAISKAVLSWLLVLVRCWWRGL